MKRNKTEKAWFILPLLMAAMFLVFMVLGGIGYFEFSPPERTCISCHEIRVSHAHWSNSVHRSVSCKACHGGSADSFHALRENFKRVFSHLTETRHEDIRLSEEQTVRMMQACQQCHQREYAYWNQGGHGTNYAAIFMNTNHNSQEQMAAQCLRCHGMFYAGSIADLVTPLNIRGPWQFRNPVMAQRPVIPCMACHELHAPGELFHASATNSPVFRRETIALYSRTEKAHFAIDDLLIPKIVHNGHTVKVSSDPRQRLCTQCHAPNAFGHAGSSDDRTPTGVHEGLSCAACHAPHSNDTRASCALCHPARSSCGLDVTRMDTSFRSPTSQHNIHRMTCLECHPEGVPKKKDDAPSKTR